MEQYTLEIKITSPSVDVAVALAKLVAERAKSLKQDYPQLAIGYSGSAVEKLAEILREE